MEFKFMTPLKSWFANLLLPSPHKEGDIRVHPSGQKMRLVATQSVLPALRWQPEQYHH